MSTVEAWHFLPDDGRLRYPPHDKVEVGVTLKIEGSPVLCERGFHASIRAIDAVYYAPGALVCRVRLGGEIIHGDDKLVATERTVLWMADATNALHECACLFAEEALRAAKVNDPRCHAAIDAKRKWLRVEIDDDALSAAESAAWSAARSAAELAARPAARSAAESAARSAAELAALSAAESAAESAARSAARSAAESAAESAARSAAWSAVWSAAWSDAWSAARSAAQSAAWSAQNTILERELMKLAPVPS